MANPAPVRPAQRLRNKVSSSLVVLGRIGRVADERVRSADKVETSRQVRGHAWQIFKYLLVGGSAFVLDFGLLALLKSGLGAPAWFAAIVAFAVSTAWSFYLQRRFTFSADLHVGQSAVRYGILLVTNMLLTAGIVELFDRLFDLYLVGKVVSTGLMTLWNFPIMKYWVYPRSAGDQPDPVRSGSVVSSTDNQGS